MVPLLELLSRLGVPLALIVLAGLVILAFNNPQATKIWIGEASKGLGVLSSGVKNWSLGQRLEGRINAFAVEAASEIPQVGVAGVRVVWADPAGHPDAVFEGECDLVLVLPNSQPEGRNLARAALLYVTKLFIPRAKLYMTRRQRESMDLFVTGRLLDLHDSALADEFYADFVVPALRADEDLGELVDTYRLMDKAGLFLPVLLQELSVLGSKVAVGAAAKPVEDEIRQLIRFLRERASRRLGDDSIPLDFLGHFCRFAIVLVGKREKREAASIDPYVRAINGDLANGCDRIYVMGENSHSSFMERIIDEITLTTNLIVVSDIVYEVELQWETDVWAPAVQRLFLLTTSTAERYLEAGLPRGRRASSPPI